MTAGPNSHKPKQGAEFEIEVAGEPFVWRLQRQPHWSSKVADRHGMAITVRHTDGQREAVLEFPAGSQPRHGAPKLNPSQIAPSLVATAITSAIAAGWDPQSRGKTVTIVVDETGG